MITVKVPASAANLGPGFDVLGLALTIYNIVEIEIAESSSLEIQGEGEGSLSPGKNNLIWSAIAEFYGAELGQEPPELKIKMKNNIPLARGMGSSAATIVAAVTAANELSARNLNKDAIFALAAKIEGHPDNVAAAVYGGATAAFIGEINSSYKAVSFTPHRDLSVLLLVSGEKLSTKAARAALPNQLNYEDAVFNLSRVALLVKALISGDFDLLKTAMEDRLHQPYRTKLIPELGKAIEICYQAGAAGAALSGAGPSVIALTSKDNSKSVADSIKSRLVTAGLIYDIIPCDIDVQGATMVNQ